MKLKGLGFSKIPRGFGFPAELPAFCNMAFGGLSHADAQPGFLGDHAAKVQKGGFLRPWLVARLVGEAPTEGST